MFIIYVTLATKILSRQLIFPKNVINETVYLLSARGGEAFRGGGGAGTREPPFFYT